MGIPRRSDRVRSCGFTLLELLVAIAIMAMSLSVLYRAVSSAIGNLREAERHAYAVSLATSLLALHETIPRGGLEAEGVEGPDGDGFRWKVSSWPVEMRREGAPGWPVYRTDVRVRWSAGMGEREFRLSTINLERPVPIR